MPCRRASLGRSRFIEIMMVVAIIGLVMTIGVPAILRQGSRSRCAKRSTT